MMFVLSGCGSDDNNDIASVLDSDEWEVKVNVFDEYIEIQSRITDVFGNFVHISIRKEGHDNGYSIQRSPAPNQPKRDWSRVHTWFGELNPDTYLEGRFDDGSNRGPKEFTTLVYHLPRASGNRQNYADQNGSDYEYITIGYNYADGQYYPSHPGFDAGQYEIEIYAWYTGQSTDTHPAVDDSPGVQYVHYEWKIITTEFTIE